MKTASYIPAAFFLMVALFIGIIQTDVSAAERAPVRVLILSGRSNHDWKTTTPALKKILEDNGTTGPYTQKGVIMWCRNI